MKGVAALLLVAAPAGARETIGVYRTWGAFRDAQPARCFAIAQPVGTAARAGFATVATWPGRGLRSSLHVRLSHGADRATAVTLSVGERRFALAAGDRDAWATDAASDRAIVSAMRSGRSMSVEGLSVDGRPFADVYLLAGAATAIDAAALACTGAR